MAKNESTAVNELLQLMATQKPLPPDPADDLMFRPPAAGPDARRRTTGALPAQAPPVGVATMQGLGPVVSPPQQQVTAAPGVATMQGLGQVIRGPAHATSPREVAASAASAVAVAPVDSTDLRRRPSTAPPLSSPVAAPYETEVPKAPGPRPSLAAGAAPRTGEMASEMTMSQAWYAEGHKVEQPDQALIGTLYVSRRRRRGWRTHAARLVAPMAILLAMGVLVGGYFVYAGPSAQREPPAPTTPSVQSAGPAEPAGTAEPPKPASGAAAAVPSVQAATPAEAATSATSTATPPAAPPAPASTTTSAPEAAEAATAATAPSAATAPASSASVAQLVDVLIVSSPAGATVDLIDRGETSFVGTTPISTALDPSRTYQLVFSHPSGATQTEPLDPSTTRRVDVKLARTAAAAPSEARPASAPSQPRKPNKRAADGAAASAVSAATTAPAGSAPAPAVAVAVAPAPASPAPGGDGVLMISSKPPCEIIIDDKATGLTTPQRSISLPAGPHKITLVNASEDLTRTFSVSIAPGETTKVIQNLMAP